LVRIDISRNGGAFQPITTSFRVTGGAASVFPWVVSGPASANTRVRVTWLDGAVQGTSGIFAVAMPTLTVTAPNGGEIFAVGSTRTIRWTHTIPAGGGVNLDVSRDGGVTWTPIALNVGNTNATTGSFNWVVSGPATATARIRVRWTADAAANDISNANFTIAAPSLTVAQPSGNVGIGSTQNIRVTSNLGPSSVLNLELTRDDGLSWQPVGSGTTNNNGVVSFAWLVESPTTAGAVARIRATWTTNFTVFDESVSFAILNP